MLENISMSKNYLFFSLKFNISYTICFCSEFVRGKNSILFVFPLAQLYVFKENPGIKNYSLERRKLYKFSLAGI